MVSFDKKTAVGAGDRFIVNNNGRSQLMEIVRDENPLNPRDSKFECFTAFAIFDHRFGLECEIMSEGNIAALQQVCEKLSLSSKHGHLDGCDIFGMPLWCHNIKKGDRLQLSTTMTKPDDIQVGWIAVSKEDALLFLDDADEDDCDEDWRSIALNIVNKSVDIYNAYLEKNIFGYRLHETSDINSPVEIELLGHYGNTYEEAELLRDFPFIENFSLQLNGDIDAKVEYWHSHETGNSLPEFLCVSREEYENFVKSGGFEND